MSVGTHDEELTSEGEGRRDFLILMAGALGAVGAAATVWPFIDSLEPSQDVIAAGAPIDVDLSPIKPGQQIVVAWRSKPIFVLHRTDAQLKMLQEPKDLSLLSDPNSEAHQQPGYAQNWHRSINPKYFVVVGICTHLGCVPEYKPQPGSVQADWIGGYFCPCHGSKYDFSARVYSGVPAPYNLPVPPYRFVKDTIVRIGENPAGSDYSLSSIEQI